MFSLRACHQIGLMQIGSCVYGALLWVVKMADSPIKPLACCLLRSPALMATLHSVRHASCVLADVEPPHELNAPSAGG